MWGLCHGCQHNAEYVLLAFCHCEAWDKRDCASKVVKAKRTDTYGEIMLKVDRKYVNQPVEKIIASKNKHFIDPGYEFPLEAPVILCIQYGNNLCYYLTMREQECTAVTSV